MGYVIVSDSRRKDEVLFMVDRRKQGRSFWSDRLDDVFVFQIKDEANRKAASLKFNNARVMSYSEARKWESDSQNETDHNSAMNDVELGWDAHKIWSD